MTQYFVNYVDFLTEKKEITAGDVADDVDDDSIRFLRL